MNVLRISAVGSALVVLCICIIPEPAAGSQRDDAKDRIHVRGTKVSLVKPALFKTAERFAGLQYEKSELVTIMITEMPAPFKEATAGFTPEKLKAAGMTLLSKEEVEIAGQPGILLHLTQTVRDAVLFEKWIAAFGNEKETTLITASFPEVVADTQSATLRRTVLSARLEKERAGGEGAGLGFTLTAPPSLKQAGRVGNIQAYTKDGAMPTKKATDPLVVAGYAISNTPVTDQKRFAQRRLLQTEQIKGGVVESSQGTKIGGLDAWEMVVTSKDRKTDDPLLVYQVILFDGDTYFIMTGLVGLEQRDKLLPDFKTMARSFRKK